MSDRPPSSTDRELASLKQEDYVREIAREEAQNVYEELAVEDADGETWSLSRFMGFGLTRRQALQAVGYVALGASGSVAALRAISGVAAANPAGAGDIGTPAKPADIWASNIYGPNGDVEFQDPIVTPSVDAGTGTVTANEATIDGKTGIGVPATSSEWTGASFGTWRQASATRPALIMADVFVKTDGSTSAEVDFKVDESGGTTADYTVFLSFADKALGANAFNYNFGSWLIPAGAQYQIVNTTDPTGGNSIHFVREMVL